jgi:hypothetical protein
VTGPASLNARLRLSGLLAASVFIVMAVSDLLLLTRLDLSLPHRFWEAAPGLPLPQVRLGYFLGVLALPLHTFTSAWHLSLAVRPAGAWAPRLVFGATAYSAALLALWHGSFAFLRSTLRAEQAAGVVASGPGPETLLAYAALALPIFRVALVVAALAYATVFVLALTGKTLYPRWAGIALPAVYVAVVFLLAPLVPQRGGVILDAAGWNLGGVAAFALSTAILWNRRE